MRGECRAAWFERLMASLLLANGRAGEIFSRAGVVACTDVTGFGLAGHLLEMLDGSRVSARLTARSVPLYEGFAEVVGQGIVSSLHRDNAKASCRVHGAAPPPEWLFDPQTSGGLLGAVGTEAVAQTLEELHRAGYQDAAVIGQVIPMGDGSSPVIVVE
jgi:selenide,water dikinase